MTNKNASKTAATLALMGLLKVSLANAEVRNFTPIEKLPPDQRQLIAHQIDILTKDLHIDWDEIAVGIDENGKVTLVSKIAAGLKPTINPSCYSKDSNTDESCK